MFDSGARYSWKSPPSSRADANAAASSTPFETLRRRRRQQRHLHALREAHFLLEPDLIGAHLLVESGVFDRHRRLARQQAQDLDVPLAERIELRALQIDDADAAILEQERNRELGLHVRHQLDVARVARHVGDEYRFLVERGVADEPFAEAHAWDLDFLTVLDGEAHLELVGLVQQQDAEGPIVDELFGQLRDAREQLVEIEHRRDLARDLGKRLEGLGVAAAMLEQPRVDERDRDVRGKLPHDRDVALGELVAIAG